jgi:DNA segregation ATPase FtsK/SpoIIIE-like protein
LKNQFKMDFGLNQKATVLGFGLLGLSGILFILIMMAMLHMTNLFGLGTLFFQSFSYAALYLPLYTALLGYLSYSQKLNRGLIMLLNLTFVPFLTLAILCKILFATDHSWLEQQLLQFFPIPASPVMLLTLFLIEIVLLVRFYAAHSPVMQDQQLFSSDDSSIASTNTSHDINLADDNIRPVNVLAHQLDDSDVAYREEDVDLSDRWQAILNGEQDDTDEMLDLESKDLHTHDELENLIAHLEHEQENLVQDMQQRKHVVFHELDHPDDVDNFAFAMDAHDADVGGIESDTVQTDLQKTDTMSNTEQHHITDPYLAQHEKQLANDNHFIDETGLLAGLREVVFTPEEQNALNLAVNDIAQNWDEEQRMASLLKEAHQELDMILTQPIATTREIPQPSIYRLPETLPSYKEENSTESSQVQTTVSYEERDRLTNIADDDSDKDISYADVLPQSGNYYVATDGLLDELPSTTYGEIDDQTREAGHILERTLSEFNIEAHVTSIHKGPVITLFELLPAAGVKLSRIEALADNIAFRLAASRVRIVAPIPGKQAVGIEVPNANRSLVSFSQLINSAEMQDVHEYIPLALGKDISGQNQVFDLAKMPHLLIAGSTGSGKSVCVNSIICSILFSRSPRDVRMLLIDPKVVELKPYNDVPHLLTPVISEPQKALQAIQWAVGEMERRYALLDSVAVRNIRSYNKKIKDLDLVQEALPYLVIIIDEFADLMATCGRELEGLLARLAAKSRAAGMHLILATQRPSVDVITGLIKANFPSRIAFMVASRTDSRIILDASGAEQLLGKGDMLFVSSWSPFPIRIQGAFLSEDEVERVTEYIKSLGQPQYIDDEIFTNNDDDSSTDDISYDDDPLYEKAIEIVRETGKATASYLQRRLKLGYNRAARLIDMMEKEGIVGPSNGSKARDVY